MLLVIGCEWNSIRNNDSKSAVMHKRQTLSGELGPDITWSCPQKCSTLSMSDTFSPTGNSPVARGGA